MKCRFLAHPRSRYRPQFLFVACDQAKLRVNLLLSSKLILDRVKLGQPAEDHP